MLILSLFVVAFLAAPSHQLGPQMGPVGRIILKMVVPCTKEEDNAFHVALVKDGQKRNVLDAQLDLAEDFNKNYKFRARIHKWTGSEKKENVMKYEGAICEYLNKYLKNIRQKVMAAVNIKTDCPIPKGTYKWKGIHGTEKDVTAAAIPYGTFQIILELMNPKKKVIACYVVDLDSLPK